MEIADMVDKGPNERNQSDVRKSDERENQTIWYFIGMRGEDISVEDEERSGSSLLLLLLLFH